MGRVSRIWCCSRGPFGFPLNLPSSLKILLVSSPLNTNKFPSFSLFSLSFFSLYLLSKIFSLPLLYIPTCEFPLSPYFLSLSTQFYLLSIFFSHPLVSLTTSEFPLFFIFSFTKIFFKKCVTLPSLSIFFQNSSHCLSPLFLFVNFLSP